MDAVKELEQIFAATVEMQLPAALVQQYDILECLSQSSQQDTYLARNVQTGEKVVVKCYPTDSPLLQADMDYSAIPGYVEEYANETYRCIVRVYYEGMNLHSYVKSHALTESECLDIALQLACKMDEIHRARPAIIHRDIKPQNIIVQPDGTLALIDFGICRVYKDGQESDTEFCGTADFAPPEQYGFRQTDIRSDIYSYGIVLAWMLTGETKIIKNPKTKLAKIAARCCAFTPEKRYQNDKGILHDLCKCTEQYRKRIRILRYGICGALLLAALVIGGVTGMRYLRDRKQEAPVTQVPESEVVVFGDDLLEEAVRLSLGVKTGDITYADLEEVQTLYVVGMKAVATENEYWETMGTWGSSGERHGSVSDLSLLAYMPNLRKVFFGGQKITDISTLKNLEYLEDVELRDNYIQDASALANKKYLQHVGLCNNQIKSIEFLETCPNLINIDLHNAGVFDGSPLAQLSDLDFLDIAGQEDLSEYLEGKRIRGIMLGAEGQTDIAHVKEMEFVQEINISWSEVKDISALEGREDVITLHMSGCLLYDVEPLFHIPNLSVVEISKGLRDDMEQAIKKYGEPSFEITYTE